MCTCLGVLETSLPALRNHPTSDTHCSLKFAHISLLRTSFWVQRVTQTMRPMFPKLKPRLGNRGLGFFKATRRPAQLAAAAARPVSPRLPHSFLFLPQLLLQPSLGTRQAHVTQQVGSTPNPCFTPTNEMIDQVSAPWVLSESL